MNVINHQQLERERHRMQSNREELVERMMQAPPGNGVVDSLAGLYLIRWSKPLEPIYGVPQPSLCMIAQGSKEILLGDRRYRYDPFHYFLATVRLPGVGRILEASEERPFLGLVLELSPALVGSVMVEAGATLVSDHAEVGAIDVSPLEAGLLDAFVRLVRLLDTPSEAPVLQPLITREIIYRLLLGAQGGRLHYLAKWEGYMHLIARAIQILQQDFDKPLRIEEIAHELGISISSFHHHFKVITAMTPLQYQRQLRLQEARRLMIDENFDAAGAAYRVGYRDASYFNREYKKLFGVPPMHDVRQLREATAAVSGR